MIGLKETVLVAALAVNGFVEDGLHDFSHYFDAMQNNLDCSSLTSSTLHDSRTDGSHHHKYHFNGWTEFNSEEGIGILTVNRLGSPNYKAVIKETDMGFELLSAKAILPFGQYQMDLSETSSLLMPSLFKKHLSKTIRSCLNEIESKKL